MGSISTVDVLGDVRLNPPFPDYLTISHGRLVTLYPVAPALVAVPFFAPQVAMLDLIRPGWDRNRQVSIAVCRWMAKRAMAAIVALTGVILHRLLLALGLQRVAVPGRNGGLPGIGSLDCGEPGAMAAWAGSPVADRRDRAIASASRLAAARSPWRGHLRPYSSPVG